MDEEESEVKETGPVRRALKTNPVRDTFTPVLSVKKVRGSTVVSAKKPGRRKTLN